MSALCGTRRGELAVVNVEKSTSVMYVKCYMSQINTGQLRENAVKSALRPQNTAEFIL